MKVLRKRLLWILLGFVFVGFLVAGFIYMIPEPPEKEFEAARQALASARSNQADVYAREIFREAGQYYDSAMKAWKEENQRFIIMRDYKGVIRLSEISALKSQEAIKLTKSSSTDLEKRSRSKIHTLNGLLNDINKTFSRFPLSKHTRLEISRGKLLLSEAQVAFNNKLFIDADNKLSQAEKLLNNAHTVANRLIREYFENHRQWKTWMDQTIAESKQKKIPVIIVDKFASKCYVYKNGKQTAEFEAELGKNWVGDKRQRGDHATPEGRYKITQKKEGRATKYYKALLINYPNDDDKQRFRSEVANGSLPHNTHIGGLIEIHGHGGKGADWTEGCVALTDSDMDKLYKMVSVGTPVTIIGSIADLNEILRN